MNTQQILNDIKVLRTNNSWDDKVPEWASKKAAELSLPAHNYKVIEAVLIEIIQQQDKQNFDLSQKVKELSAYVAGGTLKIMDATVETAKSAGSKVSGLFAKFKKPIPVSTDPVSKEQSIIKV